MDVFSLFIFQRICSNTQRFVFMVRCLCYEPSKGIIKPYPVIIAHSTHGSPIIAYSHNSQQFVFFTAPCLTSVPLAFRYTGDSVPHSVKILIRFVSEVGGCFGRNLQLKARDGQHTTSRPSQCNRLQCSEYG